MSRDWTPQLNRWVDSKHHFSQNKVVWTNLITGKEEVVVDPECETAKRYPLLYFLYGYNLEKFMLAEMTAEFVSEVEHILKEIATWEDANKRAISTASPSENIFYKDDEELISLVIEWYEGKLDPDFYYNDRNNEYFLDGLRKLAGLV